MNALSASATTSAVVHAAAIGALLTIKPVPYPSPKEEMIEVSLESGEAPDRRRLNGTAAALPSNGPGDGNPDHAFSLPAPPTFKLSAQSLLLDALRRMLDCLAVEGSSDGAAARRPPARGRPPCLFAGVPLRAPVMPSTNAPESDGNGVRAADDYRHFKTERPMFDESLLPDKVPEGNRALKSWFARLFR